MAFLSFGQKSPSFLFLMKYFIISGSQECWGGTSARYGYKQLKVAMLVELPGSRDLCVFKFQNVKIRGIVTRLYLSNKPWVSMVYTLITQAGCWQNTRRIRKSRAPCEWCTNSSSVLPTCQDARFFHEFTGTLNHSWLTDQSARIDFVIIEWFINVNLYSFHWFLS